MSRLPEYQCHKKVRAAKILNIDYARDMSCAQMVLDTTPVTFADVDVVWLNRNISVDEGGYFVEYDDGYTSYSPAEPFESGYTLIGGDQ